MAEPIGITSGLVALATFAFQSSLSLYQAIANFQSNKRIVRELKEELEALEAVLKSLQVATTDNTVDLPALKLPLLRCGQACREFEALIAKCTTHSNGSKTSIRDWAKLTYMGDDIVGFKNMLAGYKATICIALGDANLYI
jgi:Fungal N-terminal domain of STAND proteins